MRSARKKPIQQVPKYNQFPGYDNFTLLQRLSDNRKIYYDQYLSRKIECCHLVLDKKNSKDWKEMYSWRSKTQLPIINTLFLEFLQQSHNEVKLNIFNQYCPQRLSDFSEIPLNQILYLMKQSLIGFERLYSKVKGFEVNSNMIAINDSKKCKVWLHEDFAKNDAKRIQIDEQQYLRRIINIYSAFVLRTSLSRQFFQRFTNVKQFLQAFAYIDMFANKYKILIPSRFVIEPPANRKFSFYYRPKFNELSSKNNDNRRKKSWNKAQQITVKKNINISTHFSELSEQISNKNYMKYSNGTNGTNGTTQVTSINQMNLMNPMQISLLGEDFQGSKQECYYVSSQENRSYKKVQQMFHSEISQLNPKIIENQQKLSSGYKMQMKLKVIKKSHQLSPIQECIQKNANKIQKLWNPTDITAQQDSFQEQNSFQQEIFRRNGWANKINNLITVGKQIKQSVTIGKDIHSAVKLRKLELLNRFGRNIGNSRLVHDFTQ